MLEPAPKKLYRLPDEGQILGVCAGIAEYFAIDPTVVRVIAIILLFATQGFIVVAYLITALILPVKTTKPQAGKNMVVDSTERGFIESTVEPDESRKGRILNYVGLGLIALGAWLLLERLFPSIFAWDRQFVWPVVLLMVGLWILLNPKGRR